MSKDGGIISYHPFYLKLSMPTVKISITVTDKQDAWTSGQMESGNYATDSELIREALREKQSREAELQYIRAKLIEAEQSGFTDMKRNEFPEEFKSKLRDAGELWT